MRLKKVKNAIDYINKSKYFISNPKECKKRYQKIFNNQNPIHLEIGMGKGDFIIENALRNPNINYIGFEKYDSVLIRAIEKADALDIKNLFFINEDANGINDIFGKEIDLIYLNFSDPWPKKRHAKRRLSSIEFLKKYDEIFKNVPHIIMKTDNRSLFEFSLKEFTDYGYKINTISLDLHKDDIKDNIMTEYEIKFSSKGFPIYKVDINK